jgi:hypothetical protein
MLDTRDGFLLLFHNLAFKEVSKLNGFILCIAISVSGQSVSRYRVMNVRTHCVSINLIFSKVCCVACAAPASVPAPAADEGATAPEPPAAAEQPVAAKQGEGTKASGKCCK